MAIDRRHFIGATAATGAFTATETVAAPVTPSNVPVSGPGVDAIHLGVRFNGSEDNTEEEPRYQSRCLYSRRRPALDGA